MTEFETLYNDYFHQVYLYIRSLCNDEHVAEDITSETFLKAMGAIDNFKGNCDIRIWLCQIAKNSYFSYLRKNKKILYEDQTYRIEDSFSIEKSMTLVETSMEIHEVLHSLKEPYKEVFSLRTFGELSFKQIGSLFHKSENWACVTYHRAREKIMNEWRIKYEGQL